MNDTALDIGAGSTTATRKKKQTIGVVFLSGKISQRNEHEGNHYTRIKFRPMPDEDSQTVEVRSKNSLGMVGDTVDVNAVIGGWNQKPRGSDNTYNRINLTLESDYSIFALER